MSRHIVQPPGTPMEPSLPSRKVPLVPVALVSAGVLFAFSVWTLPNWALFTQIVASFSILWQIAANRQVIMTVVLKMVSPILVGSGIAACIWLWYLIKPFLEEETQVVIHSSQRTPLPETLELIPQNNRQDKGLSMHTAREQRYNEGNEERQTQGEKDVPLPSPKPQAGAEVKEMGEQRSYQVAITMLKKVSMRLMTAQGISREVPLSLNAKRVQLLAYLAWQQGQSVNRDRMLEQVFGHGKDDEEATREKLGESFDSHKKLIRWDLREAINQLNTEAGTILIPPNLDIFAHKQRLYWLSEVCSVVDLEEIERHHKVIERARKDGLLVDQVPDYVKNACDQLMMAYTGDFLEEVINDYLDDFEPWVSSWARKPYTLFRDYYLQALWYAAEYELRQGQEGEKERRKHWGLAAQHYRNYAMTACISRFDLKVTFAGREYGERVIMSERALRRSLVLYGSIGATHLVDQVYSAYYKQMRSISAKAWEPSKDTMADLQSAKEQTNAYRFPTRVTPHETLPSMDNLETSA